MRVLLIYPTRVPVFAYGGTERVIWDLAKGLVALGHEVTLMVSPGSSCPFARVIEVDANRPLLSQMPRGEFDIAHFQFRPDETPDMPFVVTEHGNTKRETPFPLNTVFLSRNHAQRYGAQTFVHNGLDWDAYGPVDPDLPRVHHHFLGKGAWPVKNLRGAIRVARLAGTPLAVLGGRRLNLSRTWRFTPWPSIRFHGMVGGETKFRLLNQSRGLILPVRWHEPFGLAVIESLYFGCPVFATPYGALPELVSPECGVLAADAHVLANAVRQGGFSAEACQERARLHFNHLRMARGYVEQYQRVLDGESLNATQPVLKGNGHALLPWRN
ncbi:MAG: glycosyltransferase [Hydrogenophaga sp.]|uniref:glycosyltransferase n=1 Tax=Hydrogenophaga sp. TaxID=1904254 RepID=UPI001DE09A69|nr:glycosyltransferase [Hydrogenophaga sp.]MBX3609966.1 glycosyltransferase [Hydrogenophaga sp.]